MYRFLSIAILFVLTGCAAPSEIMIRPSDGATIRCSSMGVGILGTPAALISKSGCVSDFRALGYVTSDEYKNLKNQINSSEKIISPLPFDSGNNTGKLPISAEAVPGNSSNLKPVSGRESFFSKSDDSGYSVTLSNEWISRPLPESIKSQPGALFVANEIKGAYFILTVEDAADVSDFKLFNESKLKELSSKLTNAYKSNIEYITVNGKEASRFETSGTLHNGQNVHYLYTMIRGGKKIIKVTAWSGQAKFDLVKKDLNEVAYAVKVSD